MTGIKISDMRMSHPTEVDFLTKHNITVVVTNLYIYTITIKNASAFEAYQNEYDSSKNADYTILAYDYGDLINPNATQQEMGEYALLKMYGDAINLTRRSRNGTDDAFEVKLNNSNQRVTLNNPCN